ncbi:glycoside hydrolase family 3 protein [Lacrimispora indolis]|uniref:glycoside hydrolase family 3 protein n=1 Tax=Lacrimispora indolis TaxID=69825 RepID=UPI00047F5C6A|nr:glycoside hydrolase family 3 N-terminal domain-containing protein [Lacrimispora indolis]
MKLYKYMVFHTFFLLPLLLTGCGKYVPYISSPNTESTGISQQASSGTEVSPAPQSTEATAETEPEKTPDSGAAGQTESPLSQDLYETRARELLSSMTLEEKVGQMFFVRLRKDSAIEDIKTYHLGGFILFGDDFKDETKDSIKELIKSYQSTSSIPLLIGADEEGGTVCRVSKHTAFRSEPFQSPQDLYKQGGMDAIRTDTREKAALLLGLGINVNLAPVCDVSSDPNDFIYRRSFGQEAGATADYVKTVIEEMKKERIGSTLKHFPGYGSNGDTHTGSATDTRNYDQFVRSDFLPFQTGIQAGADSVLVSHNIVTSIDEQSPASLSPAVHDILREALDFQGVIMTDDLSMEAIKDHTSDADAAVLAITAGNDLLVATDFDTQIPAVLNSVNNGILTEERINASVVRVLVWKLKLGIL